MNIPTGKSILECPQCGGKLINIASRVERVHPVPRFIDKHYWTIVVVWTVGCPVLTMAPALFVAGWVGRGLGLGWLGAFFIPFIIMYFLVRMFPLYRVTDCPYCGYHEELRLGHSDF